jgi:hypothetical protein
MTYQVLKRGPAIRAAVVIAGASDLEAMGRYRPEFVNGDEWYDGWACLDQGSSSDFSSNFSAAPTMASTAS